MELIISLKINEKFEGFPLIMTLTAIVSSDSLSESVQKI